MNGPRFQELADGLDSGRVETIRYDRPTPPLCGPGVNRVLRLRDRPTAGPEPSWSSSSLAQPAAAKDRYGRLCRRSDVRERWPVAGSRRSSQPRATSGRRERFAAVAPVMQRARPGVSCASPASFSAGKGAGGCASSSAGPTSSVAENHYYAHQVAQPPAELARTESPVSPWRFRRARVRTRG